MAAVAEDPRTGRAVRPAREGASILIVDDEELTCWALGKGLTAAGWRVRCAHAAEEALATLERAPVDLLVTDVGLPGASGLELLEEVRRRWPATHCLVITAHWDESVRERAMELGAAAALPKPLELEAFKRTVAALLGRERGGP